MRKLILMSGIPGAGKTTYAHSIKNAYVISNDDIRYSLTGGVFLNQKEWNALPIEHIQSKMIVEASKQSKVVVLDCTALTNERRIEYYNKYKDYFDKFELILMNTNITECIHRNSQRERVVPTWKIVEMSNQLETINKEVKNLFRVKIIDC